MALVLVLAQAHGPAVKGPEEEIPLSLRVNRAIARGVDYLKSVQQGDGSFLAYSGLHPCGGTALAAFTMASSGVRRDDPALQNALEAVQGFPFESVYSASMHLLLCEAMRDPSLVSEAKRSLSFLLEHQKHGVWAYPWGRPDNSNTQFALLALRAAMRMGLDVPLGYLVESAEGLEVFGQPQGGFGYVSGREANAGMTAATLASVAVLTEAAKERAKLRSVLAREAGAFQDAEAWLERNFDPGRNVFTGDFWRPMWQYAYLYAVERWCGLTGRQRLGKRDWYAEGATWLLENQRQNGSFGFVRTFEDTCFALLFLRRATMSPVGELEEIYTEIDRQREEGPLLAAEPGPEARRLTRWWLAGPWPQAGNKPILMEPPFDPAAVKPGSKSKTARREWKAVQLEPDEWVRLHELAEGAPGLQLWALSTWLVVEEENEGEGGAGLQEARLWLELQNGWDLWVDGKRLARERRRTQAVWNDVSYPLRLAPGSHRLTILLEDLRVSPAVFGAFLTSPWNGAPPAGWSEQHVVGEPGQAKQK